MEEEMITPNGRRLGRKPPTEDARDRKFVPRIARAAGLIPPFVDLTEGMPPAFDQGQLGSCGPNSGIGLMASFFPGFVGSRLQLYYNVRAAEGTIGEDAGVQTRDVLKALQRWGVGPEDDWPYDISRFTDPPAPAAIAAADRYRLGSYESLQDEDDILSCLAERRPFLLGFDVPIYFDGPEVATHGVLQLPGSATVEYLGGHDTLAMGYDLNFKSNPDFLASGIDPALVQDHALLVRNSWRLDWGLKSIPRHFGHFWMPMKIPLSDRGGDNWTGRPATSAASQSGPSIGGASIQGQFLN
jgi:hypothetical protein